MCGEIRLTNAPCANDPLAPIFAKIPSCARGVSLITYPSTVVPFDAPAAGAVPFMPMSPVIVALPVEPLVPFVCARAIPTPHAHSSANAAASRCELIIRMAGRKSGLN